MPDVTSTCEDDDNEEFDSDHLDDETEEEYQTYSLKSDNSTSSHQTQSQSSTSPSVTDSSVENYEKRKWCRLFYKLNVAKGQKSKSTSRYVRCAVCVQYPSVVALHCHRQRIPPIAMSSGTRYREQVLREHENHPCHAAALKVKRRSELADVNPMSSPIISGLRNMEKSMFKKISLFMLDVYNDAQRGTLSAWSWPSRVLTRLKAENMKIDEFSPFSPTSEQIQYLNPTQHREFLSCIASVGRKGVSRELQNALAVSLHVDGSVDRQQIDNKHVCAHIVTTDGDVVQRFLGFSEPNEHGIMGYLQSIKDASQSIFQWNEIIQVTTSIVTDGESLNTGGHNGLWRKLEDEKRMHDNSNQPLLKVWCAAHRSNLAYKDISKSVSEVRMAVVDVVSVGSYFHVSGVRTHD